MPKTAQIALAGRPYVLTEKHSGPATAWRNHLNASQTMRIFQSLDEAVVQLVGVLDQMTDNEGKMKKMSEVDVNVSDIIGIGSTLPVVVNGLSHSIDEIKDMLFDFSPELQADREWIDQNAYDSEIVVAFVEVLKLCFPFLAVLDLVTGPSGRSTSTSLPSPNGASGHRALVRRKRTKTS